MMVGYAIMVDSKNYYVHPVQSWWSIAILVLAVGKRTVLLVVVRYIYLRNMSSYGEELSGVISAFYTEEINQVWVWEKCSLFRILRK